MYLKNSPNSSKNNPCGREVLFCSVLRYHVVERHWMARRCLVNNDYEVPTMSTIDIASIRWSFVCRRSRNRLRFLLMLKSDPSHPDELSSFHQHFRHFSRFSTSSASHHSLRHPYRFNSPSTEENSSNPPQPTAFYIPSHSSQLYVMTHNIRLDTYCAPPSIEAFPVSPASSTSSLPPIAMSLVVRPLIIMFKDILRARRREDT